MDRYFINNPRMDISTTIAHNLTDWMSRAPNLNTFKKVAAKAGVGFGTVQRAKNGDGNVTVETLTAIAAAFGRSPTDLLTPPTASSNDSPEPLATTANENSAPYPVDPAALVREAAELITLWSALSPDLQAHIADLIRKAASSDTVHSAPVTPAADPPEQIHQDASHPPGNIEVLPGRPAARPGRKKTAGKPAAGE